MISKVNDQQFEKKKSGSGDLTLGGRGGEMAEVKQARLGHRGEEGEQEDE